MPSNSLSQEEANRLMAMDKFPANDRSSEFPFIGGMLEIDLVNYEEREEFILNYRQNSINLKKRNHLLRGQQMIVLARLDLDGPPHRNPDGQEIGPRHIHLYKEGFADKWAYEIPLEAFSNLDDAYKTFEDFMSYCNVVKFPNLERGLFS
jgi:hypothetical protein